jgi:hypothetical protein
MQGRGASDPAAGAGNQNDLASEVRFFSHQIFLQEKTNSLVDFPGIKKLSKTFPGWFS